ncbi:MAG: InlB B-repeat-containing protein [Eubacteriales bacterium]|nr:InlB B-repeat-containing protein [Eubacteriales bacterium]
MNKLKTNILNILLLLSAVVLVTSGLFVFAKYSTAKGVNTSVYVKALLALDENCNVSEIENTGEYTTEIVVMNGDPMPSPVIIPKRIGYDFSGYYTSQAADQSTRFYDADGTNNGGALKWGGAATDRLYAGWTPKKFNVKLNNCDEDDPVMVQVDYGSELPDLTSGQLPHNDSFAFDGYYGPSQDGSHTTVCYFYPDGSHNPDIIWKTLGDIEITARWVAPVLAPNVSWWNGTGTDVNDSGVGKDQVEHISVSLDKNYLPKGIDGEDYYAWNADAYGEGKIKAYLIPNRSGKYDLVICLKDETSSEIFLNSDSSGAFSGFTSATEIAGLSKLTGKTAVNISNLFAGDKSLTRIDLKGLNTKYSSSNTAGVFDGCDLLRIVEVDSSFTALDMLPVHSAGQTDPSLGVIDADGKWYYQAANGTIQEMDPSTFSAGTGVTLYASSYVLEYTYTAEDYHDSTVRTRVIPDLGTLQLKSVEELAGVYPYYEVPLEVNSKGFIKNDGLYWNYKNDGTGTRWKAGIMIQGTDSSGENYDDQLKYGSRIGTWNSTMNIAILYSEGEKLFTIEFNQNGSGQSSLYAENKMAGKPVNTFGINITYRTGYSIKVDKSYNTKPDGSGSNSYSIYSTYSRPVWNPEDEELTWREDGTAVLYAQWTPTNYAIKLDGNGATGSFQTSLACLYDSEMPKLNSVPQKPGYVFDGYYTNNDGTGTQYYDNKGVSCHTWDIPLQNTSLYAKWKSTVTLDMNNSGGSSEKITVEVVYNAPMPSVDGSKIPSYSVEGQVYTFCGFYSHSNALRDGERLKRYYNPLTNKQGSDTDKECLSANICDLVPLEGASELPVLYAYWEGLGILAEGNSWMTGDERLTKALDQDGNLFASASIDESAITEIEAAAAAPETYRFRWDASATLDDSVTGYLSTDGKKITIVRTKGDKESVLSPGSRVSANMNSAYAFAGFVNAVLMDLSELDSSNITDAGHMFENDSSMTTLYLSGAEESSNYWNTKAINDSTDMFGNCPVLRIVRVNRKGFSLFDQLPKQKEPLLEDGSDGVYHADGRWYSVYKDTLEPAKSILIDPTEYTLLDYVTFKSENGIANTHILLNNQYKDIKRYEFTYATADKAQHILFSAGAATKTQTYLSAPYFAYDSRSYSANGHTGVNIITSAFWRSDVSDGHIRHVEVTGNKDSVAVPDYANYYFTFGSWTDSVWSRNIDLYSLRLYDKNDDIIADLYPVKRISDNISGMYDSISGTFYANCVPNREQYIVAGNEAAGNNVVSLYASAYKVKYCYSEKQYHDSYMVQHIIPDSKENVLLDANKVSAAGFESWSETDGGNDPVISLDSLAYGKQRQIPFNIFSWGEKWVNLTVSNRAAIRQGELPYRSVNITSYSPISLKPVAGAPMPTIRDLNGLLPGYKLNGINHAEYSVGEDKIGRFTSIGKQYYQVAEGTEKWGDSIIWDRYDLNNGADITLYPLYDPNTYTVVLNPSPEIRNDFTKVQEQFTVGISKQLPPCPFSKPGFKFAGWKSTTGGLYSEQQDMSRLQFTDSVLNLYPLWTPLQCTVHLEPQNGEDAVNVLPLYGEPMPAAGSVPVKSGSVFLGYYSQKNGKGEKYYNSDMSSARLWNSQSNAEITLYAGWGSSVLAQKDLWFTRGGINKDLVYEIAFSDTAPSGYTNSWDASEGSTGSVIAYANKTENNQYKITLVDKDKTGIFYANTDSSYAFSGFKNLKAITDIWRLDTRAAGMIGGMFSNDEKLERLDFADPRGIASEGWNTELAASTSRNMFAGCRSLRILTLSKGFRIRKSDFPKQTAENSLIKDSDGNWYEEDGSLFGFDSILPDNYIRLEYIESTRYQFIDPEVPLTNNSKVESDLEVTNLYDTRYFGSYGAYGLIVRSNRWQCLPGLTDLEGAPKFGVVNHFTIESSSSGVKYDYYYDGGKTYSLTQNAMDVDRDPESFYIFAARYQCTEYAPAEFKLYSFRYYMNGQLTRDFIPCYDKDTGKTGLYDMCGSISSGTGTPFYISLGTGADFRRGPEMSEAGEWTNVNEARTIYAASYMLDYVYSVNALHDTVYEGEGRRVVYDTGYELLGLKKPDTDIGLPVEADSNIRGWTPDKDYSKQSTSTVYDMPDGLKVDAAVNAYPSKLSIDYNDGLNRMYSYGERYSHIILVKKTGETEGESQYPLVNKKLLTVGVPVYAEGDTTHSFLGYFTADGRMIFDENGAPVNNVEGYTGPNGEWLIDDDYFNNQLDIYLYGHWSGEEANVLSLNYRYPNDTSGTGSNTILVPRSDAEVGTGEESE